VCCEVNRAFCCGLMCEAKSLSTFQDCSWRQRDFVLKGSCDNNGYTKGQTKTTILLKAQLSVSHFCFYTPSCHVSPTKSFLRYLHDLVRTLLAPLMCMNIVRSVAAHFTVRDTGPDSSRPVSAHVVPLATQKRCKPSGNV
jgi:hypothetical protein